MLNYTKHHTMLTHEVITQKYIRIIGLMLLLQFGFVQALTNIPKTYNYHTFNSERAIGVRIAHHMHSSDIVYTLLAQNILYSTSIDEICLIK